MTCSGARERDRVEENMLDIARPAKAHRRFDRHPRDAGCGEIRVTVPASDDRTVSAEHVPTHGALQAMPLS
jgi:hypothetical protein